MAKCVCVAIRRGAVQFAGSGGAGGSGVWGGGRRAGTRGARCGAHRCVRLHFVRKSARGARASLRVVVAPCGRALSPGALKHALLAGAPPTTRSSADL